VQFALSKFEKIWIADGSTLEALFRKLKSLEEVKQGVLAGKMGVVMDLVTRLPVEIWFEENPAASDTRFEESLLDLVSVKTLLLLDRGFYHFQFWQQLIDNGIHFITRVKVNAKIQYEQVFTDSFTLRDRLVKIGCGTKNRPIVTLRLIEVKVGKSWHTYLTSVLDPKVLPPYVVIDLYGKRWRIEMCQPQYPHRGQHSYAAVAWSKADGFPWLFSGKDFIVNQVEGVYSGRIAIAGTSPFQRCCRISPGGRCRWVLNRSSSASSAQIIHC
jgi:hypothetical protein